MMMKTLIAVIFCVFLSSGAVAQEPTPETGAQKIHSFGDILITDWKAVLDNFAVELHKSPNAKGYIVAYCARNKFIGWPLRRANAAARFLTEERSFDARRIAVVNGGYRDEVTFELWKVAPGFELPVKPFDFAFMMSGEKAPVPFDRFLIIERGDPVDYDSEESYAYRPDSKRLYEPLMNVLRSDPGLRGCVIAYTPRGKRHGADRKLAARVKMAITKLFPVDVSRIVAFGGGRRDEKLIELWLVPPGSPLPKPTPSKKARR